MRDIKLMNSIIYNIHDLFLNVQLRFEIGRFEYIVLNEKKAGLE